MNSRPKPVMIEKFSIYNLLLFCFQMVSWMERRTQWKWYRQWRPYHTTSLWGIKLCLSMSPNSPTLNLSFYRKASRPSSLLVCLSVTIMWLLEGWVFRDSNSKLKNFPLWMKINSIDTSWYWYIEIMGCLSLSAFGFCVYYFVMKMSYLSLTFSKIRAV